MPPRRSGRIGASPQAGPPASPTAGCLLPRSRAVAGTGAERRRACLLGSAGFEEGDRGEDTTVVIVGLVQVQLDEDAADVFLDGAVGDEEAPRYAGVGASFGHQGEHLALPGAERGERVLAPAGGHQLLD